MPGVPTGRACDACRKQKKKCDEKKPACARCLRLKIPCVGSGQLRFKFQEEKEYSTRARKHHALSSASGSGSGTSTTSSSDIGSSDSSQTSSPPQTVFRVSPPPGPQNRNANTTNTNANTNGNSSAINFQLLAPESPHPQLSSNLTSLAHGFIASIKRTTDLRYNLWWSFGLWLEDVPRRLGTNEALDRAVDTLVTAHSNFACNRGPSVEVLSKHSLALRTLGVYLDDRVHAQSSSTLASVMILLIVQLFLGPTKRKYSGHAEGAAAILKARKEFGPRDAFEAKLFLSLRGSVLFEGIFNDRIKLTPEEWDDLVRNDYDSSTPDGQMLINLSKAPNLMKRGREALQRLRTANNNNLNNNNNNHSPFTDNWNLHDLNPNPNSDSVTKSNPELQELQELDPANEISTIRDEVWTIYQDCKINLSIMKHRSVENDFSELYKAASPSGKKFILEFGFAHYQRTYGIGLACTLVFNCILAALSGGLHSSSDSESPTASGSPSTTSSASADASAGTSASAGGDFSSLTDFDATYLSEEVLDLAKRSVIWKPIGSAYIVVCATAAWAATNDAVLRARLFEVSVDFNEDFHLRDQRDVERELVHTTEHLRLGNSFENCSFLE